MRTVLIVLLLAMATPLQAQETSDVLTRVANKYGVSISTVHAVAEVESGTRCGAKNGASRGVMQVQKGAAKEVNVNWPFRTCEDEVEAGVKYLKLAIEIAGDNCVAYTLYNAGLYAPKHCSAYGKRVMEFKKRYEKGQAA